MWCQRYTDRHHRSPWSWKYHDRSLNSLSMFVQRGCGTEGRSGAVLLSFINAAIWLQRSLPMALCDWQCTQIS